MASAASGKSKQAEQGKLRIGEDWNAIRIIALSQSNPLKAIAEFVENSIDAQAKHISITRGREHREYYLTVKDVIDHGYTAAHRLHDKLLLGAG